MKRVVRRVSRQDVQQMDKKARIAMRNSARFTLARQGDVLAYARQIHRKYQVNWHHRTMAEYLRAWMEGKIQNLMILAPPRTGKSELCSVVAPSYNLGRYPDEQIISASYSQRLAKRFTKNVQRYMSKPIYRKLFPNTRLGTGKREEMAERSAQLLELVGREGYSLSTSVGGPATGFGAHKVFLDDLVKGAAQALSPVVRDAIWHWYVADITTRLEGRKQQLLTMTPWHEDDLAGRALKLAANDPNAPQWTVLRFPALAEGVELGEYDPRKPGEALWPSQASRKDLLARKAMNEAFFMAMYQCSPVSFGTQLFQSHWFKRWHSIELDFGGLDKFDSIAYSIDMNLKGNPTGKETQRDMASIQVWGLKKYPFEFIEYADPANPEIMVQIKRPPDFVLLDRIAGRWTFPQALKAWVDLHKKWPMADTLVCESAANGPALVSTIESAGVNIDIVEINPQGSKKFRWSMASSPAFAGRVWVPATAPYIAEVMDQWVNCTSSAHDDDVDAMAQIINHWNDTASSGADLDEINNLLSGLHI